MNDLLQTKADLTIELEAADLAADTKMSNYLQLKLDNIERKIEIAELRGILTRQDRRMEFLERSISACLKLIDINQK